MQTMQERNYDKAFGPAILLLVIIWFLTLYLYIALIIEWGNSRSNSRLFLQKDSILIERASKAVNGEI